MKEPEMATIAALIARVLRHRTDQGTIGEVRSEVATLCAKFPAYN
jgi:glycine/serine hydroxymethyltransferase